QGLDNISGFDSHALGEITNSDRFGNLYFSNHGLGWPLESMTLFFRFLFGPQLFTWKRLFLILGNYQRFVYWSAARPAMASLFLLGLVFFSFIDSLSHLFFLFLDLAVPGFVLWRRHRHVLRRGLKRRLGLFSFLRLRAGFRLRLWRRCFYFRLRL